MKDALKIAGLVFLLLALAAIGLGIRFAINTMRFPDSPYWSRFF